ncbi:CHAT domain-containing protein [Solicola gregarius]|uniref:CHAT domain-containing protein n=1 Tax=Solicola gregarius TaxID=2908642 RepID=A0AA46TH74_9ACTN|nr:CHAT domain-containing protein [Solicola gregarius]UYM05075.1 CHAT domain-containing protein [Solicola gregarius]
MEGHHRHDRDRTVALAALTASQLYGRARDDETAGRLTRAASLCQEALRRSPDDDLRTRIIVTLAYLDAERGDTDGGIARCEGVLAQPDHRGVERGRTLAQLGLLLMRRGDAGRALDAFRTAVPLLTGEDAYLTRLYLNRGNVYLQRLDLAAAEADFDRARDHARSAGAPPIAAKALHNRGYARLLRGELVGALDDMGRARETLAPLSAENLAVCDQDRAEVLLAAGLIDEAGEALRSSAGVFGRRRMRQQQAECELILARLQLLVGDRNGAERSARSAMRRFGAHGSHTWALRAEVTVHAAAVASGHAAPGTSSRCEEIAVALAAEGFLEPATRARLVAALAECRAGSIDETTALLAHVRLTAATSMSNRMLSARAHAELSLARGRRSRALAHLRGALDRLAVWQATFGSLDLQAASVIHGRACALLGLQCAVEDGSLATVLEWTERARSLAGRVPVVRPPSDPTAAEQLAELRALRTSAHRDSARVASLETAVRERLWSAGAPEPAEPVRVDELRERLHRDDGTYLTYFHAGKRLYGLGVTPGSERLVDLGPLPSTSELLDGLPADLAMVATRTSASMHAVLVSSIRMRLARISERLVGPFADLAGNGPVVLSATGELADVPWSMLPGLAGRPLTIARSATSWVRAPREVRVRRPGFVAGPNVERATHEVRRASSCWSGHEELTGDDATADGVRALAARVDLLHIAAHGRHNAQNPLFSALELADGPWFGYDIDHLARIPSTIVLSACELGRSGVSGGRETIGMTVAWLHAGSTCVIASPAPVNDDLACEVLARTHARLARGAAPSAALSAAVAEFPDEPIPLLCFGAGW